MGTAKMVLGIVAIVAAVYLCATLIPPYFSNYEFEDAIKSEAQMSTYSTKSEEDIRNTVFKKAQDLEIPITKDDIKVQRSGNQGSGSVNIQVAYTVHVNLPGYPLDLHFDPSSRSRGVF
jgi:hypothetical protein